MSNGLNHLDKLVLDLLTRHFGYNSNNSWHIRKTQWGLNELQSTVCYFAEGKVEPAGGFEHPICRLRFGRSIIELHRLVDCGGRTTSPAH